MSEAFRSVACEVGLATGFFAELAVGVKVGDRGAVGNVWVRPSGAVEPHKMSALVKIVSNRRDRSRVDVTAVHWFGTFARTVKSLVMKS